MFNETAYSNLADAACETIKDRCLALWPDDGGEIKGPANQGLDKCLRDAGYWKPGGTTKCYSSQIYDLPGATTYPLDVLTNPSNPNFLFQMPNLDDLNLKSLGIGASAGIIAAIAVGAYLLLRR